MLVVTEEMQIVSKKMLAPLCLQVKCKLEGKYYKRLVFGRDSTTTIQWMYNGEYVSNSKEKILEKIYSEIESK